jgi:hypothetical protein
MAKKRRPMPNRNKETGFVPAPEECVGFPVSTSSGRGRVTFYNSSCKEVVVTLDKDEYAKQIWFFREINHSKSKFLPRWFVR